MKSSYMVMQDVNYQLFAESVEAECTFGIKHPDATACGNHIERIRTCSISGAPSEYAFRWAEAAARGGDVNGLREGSAGI